MAVSKSFKAHVLTHASLIAIHKSLQVSLGGFSSKTQVSVLSKILPSENVLNLCVIILFMLPHTNPSKQTKVRFPYVLFQALVSLTNADQGIRMKLVWYVFSE